MFNMKKESVMLGAILIFLFAVANVSASVYFSQPDSIYNIGDEISIDLDVSPIEEGFLKADLMCPPNSINVYKGVPASEGKVSIFVPLNFIYIENMNGDCYFLAEYNGQSYESREFKISDALDVRLDLDNLVIKPGENFTIQGTAKRLNGIGINGDVKITIPLLSVNTGVEEVIEEIGTNETENDGIDEDNNETEIDEVEEVKDILDADINGVFAGVITNGVFSVDIRLDKNVPAGEYRIDVLAYEEISGERRSEGLEMADLKILQILTGIDVAITNQNINPGEVFEFKPILIDQTGSEISDEVSAVIIDRKSNRIFEQIIQSDGTFHYDLPSNISSGYYEIIVSSGDIEASKDFYINEKAILLFDLRNETLIVTNIGNMPYHKDIQVDLNGKPFIKRVDLEIGESQEFKLSGSEGSYNIKITDGEQEIIHSGIPLTGNAVNVKAISNGVALNTPIVWIFIVIVLGAGLLFLFRNILKKKSFAYPLEGKLEKLKHLRFRRKDKTLDLKNPISKKSIESSEGLGNKEETPQNNSPRSLIAPKEAEQVLVLSGQKNKAAVVVLKIKNKLHKISKVHLESMIKPAYNNKAVVYGKGDYLFVIFTPVMTRSFKNELAAIKFAELMHNSIKTYNRKFKNKIEMGIAVGSGEIVNKIENKKLKFTPLKNFMNPLKKLSDSSIGKILLTSDVHDKESVNIRVEKKHVEGSDVYELKKILNNEGNQKFIEGFLDRMGKEKK